MVYECRHILPFTPWYQYVYSQYSSLHKSLGGGLGAYSPQKILKVSQKRTFLQSGEEIFLE